MLSPSVRPPAASSDPMILPIHSSPPRVFHLRRAAPPRTARRSLAHTHASSLRPTCRLPSHPDDAYSFLVLAHTLARTLMCRPSRNWARATEGPMSIPRVQSVFSPSGETRRACVANLAAGFDRMYYFHKKKLSRKAKIYLIIWKWGSIKERLNRWTTLNSESFLRYPSPNSLWCFHLYLLLTRVPGHYDVLVHTI